MPTYSYYCDNCKSTLEHFFHISEYTDTIKCVRCKSKCNRNYILDVSTQSSSIKKSDSELKTIGDLANRNRDRLSDDEKTALNQKHNAYKEQDTHKDLPKGMSRIKKPKKVKWR